MTDPLLRDAEDWRIEDRGNTAVNCRSRSLRHHPVCLPFVSTNELASGGHLSIRRQFVFDGNLNKLLFRFSIG